MIRKIGERPPGTMDCDFSRIGRTTITLEQWREGASVVEPGRQLDPRKAGDFIPQGEEFHTNGAAAAAFVRFQYQGPHSEEL